MTRLEMLLSSYRYFFTLVASRGGGKSFWLFETWEISSFGLVTDIYMLSLAELVALLNVPVCLSIHACLFSCLYCFSQFTNSFRSLYCNLAEIFSATKMVESFVILFDCIFCRSLLWCSCVQVIQKQSTSTWLLCV